MHDIANKFVDGRHGTSHGLRPTPPFLSGELAGELAGELLPAFFSSQLVCALITCLECKGKSKVNSKKSNDFIDEQYIYTRPYTPVSGEATPPRAPSWGIR
jgi:hypothetical protein